MQRDAGNDSRVHSYCVPSFSFLVFGTPSAGNATLETHQAFMLCSLFSRRIKTLTTGAITADGLQSRSCGPRIKK